MEAAFGRTHLHGEDGDVVPAALLPVQRPHRQQRAAGDLQVEELVGVAGPLQGVPADRK